MSRLGGRVLRVALAGLVGLAPLPSTREHTGASADPVTEPEAPTECGHGRLREPAGVDNPELQGTVPVVLVHGIVSSADMWSDETRNGGPTLAQTIGSMEGSNVWAFDYSDASYQWVTDQRIGPALAETIRCLHQASGRRVILVAHSMGGLAIQQALGASSVASNVAHITTIATPFEGSVILTSVNKGLDRQPWKLLTGALLDFCAQRGRQRGTDNICAILGTPHAPIGRALMVGSPELAALPPWPSTVPTFRVAGQISYRHAPLMSRQPIGDVAVEIDSALSNKVADSVPPKVLNCEATLFGALSARCFHTQLAKDAEVIDAVAEQIEPILARVLGGGAWVGKTYRMVSRDNDFFHGGYQMEGNFWFTVSPDGRVNGSAVVVYQPFFDAQGANARLAEFSGMFSDVLAVRAVFDESSTTMKGRIVGSMTETTLTIAWADDRSVDLPVTVYLELVGSSEVLTRTAIKTEQPWRLKADVTDGRALRTAVARDSNSVWYAHPEIGDA